MGEGERASERLGRSEGRSGNAIVSGIWSSESYCRFIHPYLNTLWWLR